MTCKDCYHYNMCLPRVAVGGDKICESFKDKSRIVELPCKVGETVYSFCSDFGVILPYLVENLRIGYMGKDRENYIFFEANCHDGETDELLDELDFDIEEIGKTVFLTREEAEEALREGWEK